MECEGRRAPYLTRSESQKYELRPHGRGREALGERVERVVLVLRPVEAVEQLVEVHVKEYDEAGDAEDQTVGSRAPATRRRRTRNRAR